MGALSSRVVQAVTLGLLLATATPPMARGASTVDPMVETWTPSPPVSTPLDGADGSWQRLDIPVPMYGQAAIYDPVRERMLVYHGTVLALSLAASPKWNPVVTPGTAPGLSVPSAIYDPRRDRMLLVGGNPGAPGSDVWALSLTGVATWAQLLPAGVPPSGRNASAAVYDSVRDRILVFGGYDGTARNDLWSLDLSGTPAWTQIAAAGTPPGPRWGHVAIYDPVRDRMLVHGGTAAFGGPGIDDLWELSLAGTPTWTQLTPSGDPAGRYSHTAFYDPLRDRMLVFGGYYGSIPFYGNERSDVWALNLSGAPAWSQLSPTGTLPPPRQLHSSVYDAPRDRMVIFAGEDLGDGKLDPNTYYDDVWALNLSPAPGWQELTPATPNPRLGHTAVVDPARHRMVMFGGGDLAVGGPLNETWELSLDAVPRWRPMAFDGEVPSERYYHSAIYDPVRARMLVFGGASSEGVVNDLWALGLSSVPEWSLLAVQGAPDPRFGHSAIYDPVRDRMLVFGGRWGSSYFNDVWALRLSGTPAWTRLSPLGTLPGARADHLAFYDPVRDRMLVYAGTDGSGSWYTGLWALSLSGTPAWDSISTSGTPPSYRAAQAAVYDATRDRMVMFGGIGDCCPNQHNDAWELTLSGTPTWRQLAPTGSLPPERDLHAMVFDGGWDHLVVCGGEVAGPRPKRMDTWALAFSTPAAVDRSPHFGLALSPARPNPTSQGASFDLYLPSTSAVRASVYDLAGREVARLADRTFAPGHHRLDWDGRARSGIKVPAGVYYFRVAAGGASLRRSVVVLP